MNEYEKYIFKTLKRLLPVTAAVFFFIGCGNPNEKEISCPSEFGQLEYPIDVTEVPGKKLLAVEDGKGLFYALAIPSDDSCRGYDDISGVPRMLL